MINFKDIPQFTKSGTWECNYNLVRLISYIDNEVNEFGLELNPDFQRGHVWNDEQSSKYVEFILQGGKTATVIYLNNPSWHTSSVLVNGYNDYVCVDGLQRITAIRKFINNEIKVFNHYYKQFSGHLRDHCGMSVHVNDLNTKEAVLRWYLEMNTGGIVHSKDEIERVQKLLKEEQDKAVK